MKSLITKRTIIIASVAVLIAIISIVSVNVFGSDGPVTGLANALVQPVKGLATRVVRSFESIYRAIYRYDALQEEYDELLRRYNSISQGYRESELLLDEVNWLRAALDFRERHAGHIYEEAVVGTWSSNNWVSSFTINKGYLNSVTPIARGNCVITEYGVLIGQISEVGPNTSTVVTVLDTTFAASAFVGDGGDKATIRGDFSLMGSGLLMLDYINEDTIVLPGDSIVTAGVTQVMPVGLAIGEVIEVNRYETGIGRYAIVAPLRAIDISITRVNVITSFDVSD